MATYGRNVISQTGDIIRVSFDGAPEWKAGGITVDWAAVTAVGTDTTLYDGTVIKAGYKGLQFGTILCKETSGGNTGMFAPYNSGATNGLQTFTRGECFILDSTVLQSAPFSPFLGATDNPPVFEGGRVWSDRLNVQASPSVYTAGYPATVPTLAQVLTAFPRLRLVEGA